MEWYGPGSGSTNLLFTSGFGNNSWSNNYLYTHPLTGTNQVYLNAGTYRPFLKEMEINGTSFSWAQGAYGDCFQANPFVVEPYTAINGTGAGDYEHELVFSSTTPNGSTTQYGTIQLSATTNFVPFRFKGGFQNDIIVLYFSGANYGNQKILLENIIVGGNIPGTGLNFLETDFPKRVENTNGFHTRVLCLTGLTRNGNEDLLLFEIIPQGTVQDNTFSDWEFYFTQLPTFNCNACIYDSPPYLLSASSFSATSGTCGITSLSFSVSGCATNIDNNTDFYKYIFKNSAEASTFNAYGPNGLINVGVNLGDANIQGFDYLQPTNGNDCYYAGDYYMGGCTSVNKMSFSIYSLPDQPQSDYRTIRYTWYDSSACARADQLYTDLQNQYNTFVNNYPQVTNIQSGDLGYMRVFVAPCAKAQTMNLPTSTSCTDMYGLFYFAWNTVNVTFNFTTTNPALLGTTVYSMEITGTRFNDAEVQQFKSFYEQQITCYDANGLFTLINALDNKVDQSMDSTFRSAQSSWDPNLTPDPGLDFSLTFQPGQTNVLGSGTLPVNMFNIWSPVVTSTGNFVQLTATTYGSSQIYQYQLRTITSSGVTNNSQTLIPQLSAMTCPSITGITFNSNQFLQPDGDLNTFYKHNFLYEFVVTNDTGPFPVYNINTYNITNGNVTGSPILVGTGTGGTVTVIDSNYFTP
jgi:hypothetical protein